MHIGKVLLLIMLVQPALARTPLQDAEPYSEGPDLMLLDRANGMRIAARFSSLSMPASPSHSSVFTTLYWSRAYEERAQLATRFGVHLTYGLTADASAMPQGPVPDRGPWGFAQEMRWSSARPMTGLMFERHNLLLQGDRLSIRSNSDVQALLRGAGVFSASAENDVLSLLGWRSRSQLLWQVGEPTREIQWQLTARFDRRAYAQTNTVSVGLLRRF
jgi:hypothetical protein